jgi:hypothetical protein
MVKHPVGVAQLATLGEHRHEHLWPGGLYPIEAWGFIAL